jgi:hypothetical protein
MESVIFGPSLLRVSEKALRPKTPPNAKVEAAWRSFRRDVIGRGLTDIKPVSRAFRE